MRFAELVVEVVVAGDDELVKKPEDVVVALEEVVVTPEVSMLDTYKVETMKWVSILLNIIIRGGKEER